MQTEIPFADGTFFVGRRTHVEEGGQHIYVITTTENNFVHLREMAGRIALSVQRDYQIQPAQLEYYERLPDGKLYRVDHAALREPVSPYGEASHERQFRRPVDESEVSSKLGGAVLPKTRQEMDRDTISQSKLPLQGITTPWSVKSPNNGPDNEPDE